MVRDLGTDRGAHHVVLDRVPVRPQRPVATAAHAGGDHRRRLLPYLLAKSLIEEFLRLEVMLARRPDHVDVDRVLREIRKASICIAGTVKPDHICHGAELA